MIMTDETLSVSPLHQAYCRLTGRPLTMLMKHIFAWQAFKAHGFTEEDLRLVVNLLKGKIAAKQKWTSCLDFHNLVENESNFSEALAEARSLSRAPKPTPFNRVLHQTGQSAKPAKETVRSAAEIIAANAAFQRFKNFGDSL